MNELEVYLAAEPVGTLIRKENGNLQFRYRPEYRGPRISWSMPVQPEAHPHAVCLAVFGGLLLEGEGRQVLAKLLGVSPNNDYALLEELGGDVAGALTILPKGSPAPNEPRTRALDEDDLSSTVESLPRRPLAVDPEAGIRLSLAGAQPKIPVILLDGRLALPLNSAAATTHIIKPEPLAFPGLVDNEAFCMELATAIGLRAAAVEKCETAAGHPYLRVERDDRDLTEDPIRRLHQEDLCQALGYPSSRKYQAEGGPSVTECVSLLRAASAVPASDLPSLWRGLIFNWLIGNCDAHGKNYSLLYDGPAPILAPFYDLVSTTEYPELTRRLAMSIDGAREIGDVTSDSWQTLAKSVGFSRRFAEGAVREMTEHVPAEARALLEADRHANEIALSIAKGIDERASLLGGASR